MRSRRCRSALGWSAWPRAYMHVHVARRHERQTGALAQFSQLAQSRPVVRPQQQLRRDPGAAGKALGDRACMSFSLSLWERAGVRGNKQRKTTRQAAVEIGPRERVPSLLAPAPAAGDQLGKIAVALAVGGKQHQSEAIL